MIRSNGCAYGVTEASHGQWPVGFHVGGVLAMHYVRCVGICIGGGRPSWREKGDTPANRLSDQVRDNAYR
jgi:hypothetical protein